MKTYLLGPHGATDTEAPPLVPNATMRSGSTRCRITFDDAGPDSQGRRSFTLAWDSPFGDFSVRRAQCFCAVPSEFVTVDA